jgi:Integrase core domain
VDDGVQFEYGLQAAIDNVMIERLWLTVKHAYLHLKEYRSGAVCHQGLKEYFNCYFHERPHQALGNQAPWQAFRPSLRRSARAPSWRPAPVVQKRGPLHHTLGLASRMAGKRPERNPSLASPERLSVAIPLAVAVVAFCSRKQRSFAERMPTLKTPSATANGKYPLPWPTLAAGFR